MEPLPEEIISNIVRHLRIESKDEKHYKRINFSTLAAASRANKAFARIVQPVLYRTFDNRKLNLSLLAFVAALVRNQSLIPLVHEVRLGAGSKDDDLVPNLGWTVLSQVLNFAESLPSMPTTLKDDIIVQLEIQSRSGFATLLLIMCPNITLIEMDDDMCHEEGLLATAINAEQAANQPRTYLSRLEEVVMHANDEVPQYVTFDTDNISWLSRFPTVHTFTSHGMMYTESSIEEQRLCTNLKSLFLERVDIDIPSFEQLLIKFPALEKLSVDYGHSEYGRHGDFYAKLGVALSRYGLQLSTLSLGTQGATWDLEGNSDEVDSMPPIGDLSSLGKLKCLSLHEEMLLGTRKDVVSNLRHSLPPKLEELKIIGCSSTSDGIDRLDGQLIQVVRNNRFSDLKTIVIERDARFSHDVTGWGRTSEEKEGIEILQILQRHREV